MSTETPARRWRVRLRLPRLRSQGQGPVPGEGERSAVDAFARNVDVTTLTPEQFVQVLETLHMLGAAGAGVELSSLSTEVLVDIVGNASKEQIKAVAEHAELRAVFLDEIFRRMSDHVIVEKTRNVDLVVSWRFTEGDGDGGYDRYQTVIDDGLCVSGQDLGREPDTTITLSAEDFFRIATGNATVAPAFVTGKVKVKGEYAPAVRFSNYFDIPKPGSPR